MNIVSGRLPAPAVVRHPESRLPMPPFGINLLQSRDGDGGKIELSPSRLLDREGGFNLAEVQSRAATIFPTPVPWRGGDRAIQFATRDITISKLCKALRGHSKLTGD